MVGKYLPRSEPYAAAAARALAQDTRVWGLFRSPRSTTSASVSCLIRDSRSGGTAGTVVVVSLRSSCGGGVQATLGDGATPATPPTEGVPTQALRATPVLMRSAASGSLTQAPTLASRSP